MARKCKFDSDWEQALALLQEDEAALARTAIENYQQTGVMPDSLDPHVRMIILLVRPMIDRRRRNSEAARRRRQLAKAASISKVHTEQNIPQLSAPEAIPEPIAPPITANSENNLNAIVRKARRSKMKGKKFRYKKFST